MGRGVPDRGGRVVSPWAGHAVCRAANKGRILTDTYRPFWASIRTTTSWTLLAREASWPRRSAVRTCALHNASGNPCGRYVMAWCDVQDALRAATIHRSSESDRRQRSRDEETQPRSSPSHWRHRPQRNPQRVAAGRATGPAGEPSQIHRYIRPTTCL